MISLQILAAHWPVRNSRAKAACPKGAGALGKGNFEALFEAIEREQAARGICRFHSRSMRKGCQIAS